MVLAETLARDSAPGSATAECVSSVSATVSAVAETNKIGFGLSLLNDMECCLFSLPRLSFLFAIKIAAI